MPLLGREWQDLHCLLLGRRLLMGWAPLAPALRSKASLYWKAGGLGSLCCLMWGLRMHPQAVCLTCMHC